MLASATVARSLLVNVPKNFSTTRTAAGDSLVGPSGASGSTPSERTWDSSRYSSSGFSSGGGSSLRLRREPERPTAAGGGLAQFLHATGQFRPSVRIIHAADRREAKAPASPHAKTYSIAFQQPPSFVDDRISGPPHVEAGVDLPGELVEARAVVCDLLELPQLAIAVELGSKLGDDLEKLKIAMLGPRSPVRSLEKLDQSRRRMVDMPGTEDEQTIRGICQSRNGDIADLCEAPFGPFRQISDVPVSALALRRKDLWLARRDDPLDQCRMPRGFVQALAGPRLGRVDETLLLKIAVRVPRPDRAAGSGQGGDDLCQERGVEPGR